MKKIPKFLKNNKEYYKRTLLGLLFYSMIGMAVLLMSIAFGQEFHIDVNNITNDRFPYLAIMSVFIGVSIMRLAD